ncbi:MAG: hypothetical protein CVT96_05510 [Bacteroidetes bacterium HGW-Bacteroidetes-13]|nr:MAG: hypothetical protein CVT96_05510 [Bacteroidetes bacterium HGW-Bacteroidetes-13]
MLSFKYIFIIFFSIIFLILIFRLLFKRKFYYTSYYCENKEYDINEINMRHNILSALKKSNFKKIRVDKNKFTAISLPTMSSLSELIRVEINQVTDSKSVVRFTSRCFNPIQIFDWGKNRRNSNRFFINLNL